MGSFSIWHWIVVLVVVLLLFGKNKIPGLMGDVAKGINAFKSGLKDEDAAPSAAPSSESADAPKTIHQSTDAPVSETDRAVDRG